MSRAIVRGKRSPRVGLPRRARRGADTRRVSAGRLQLGHLAIAATPLRTAASRRTVAEAMAELGLEGRPPALYLGDVADLVDLAGAVTASGVYLHQVMHDPLILVQRGLAWHAVRASIRHELCHWAQDLAGRFEVFAGGHRGRWWVSPAATRAADEAEAARFGCDERYWLERRRAREDGDDRPDMIITVEVRER